MFNPFLYNLRTEIYILERTIKSFKLKNVLNFDFTETNEDINSLGTPTEEFPEAGNPEIPDDVTVNYREIHDVITCTQLKQRNDETYTNFSGEQISVSDSELHESDDVTCKQTTPRDLARSEQRPIDGCSTLFLRNSDVTVMAHNEDVSRELVTCGCFVEGHVTSTKTIKMADSREEAFFAFSMPGILLGKGPSVNKHGVCFCSNTVLSRNVDANGIRKYGILSGKRLL